MSPVTGPAFYGGVDERIDSVVGGGHGLSVLCLTKPVRLAPPALRVRVERSPVLAEFFTGCLDVFGDCLSEATPSAAQVREFLLNDTPASLGPSFHTSLPRAVWRPPAFFRTDESLSGKVLEIQCPGSGWGDLSLLQDVYGESGDLVVKSLDRHDRRIAAELAALCPLGDPTVLHLLDNASVPALMRYLILSTRPEVRYWGYDRGVKLDKCRFIRSHSVFGLAAANYFQTYLAEADAGRLRFDLPPMVLFDQKAPLALPFWEPTRDRFSDAVRSAIAYTYPLSVNGFRDENGEWVPVDKFRARPPTGRRYYLKYAGTDVNVNWGSRSVFRLSQKDFRTRLDRALAETARGRCWVVQKECADKEVVQYFLRHDDEPTTQRMNVKYSGFYGPNGLLGIKTMHRRHFKVHGGEHTAIGLVAVSSNELHLGGPL